jgi:hypothetical protein
MFPVPQREEAYDKCFQLSRDAAHLEPIDPGVVPQVSADAVDGQTFIYAPHRIQWTALLASASVVCCCPEDGIPTIGSLAGWPP